MVVLGAGRCAAELQHGRLIARCADRRHDGSRRGVRPGAGVRIAGRRDARARIELGGKRAGPAVRCRRSEQCRRARRGRAAERAELSVVRTLSQDGHRFPKAHRVGRPALSPSADMLRSIPQRPLLPPASPVTPSHPSRFRARRDPVVGGDRASRSRRATASSRASRRGVVVTRRGSGQGPRRRTGSGWRSRRARARAEAAGGGAPPSRTGRTASRSRPRRPGAGPAG